MKSLRDRVRLTLRGHFSNKTCPKNQATDNQSTNQTKPKQNRTKNHLALSHSDALVIPSINILTNFPVLRAYGRGLFAFPEPYSYIKDIF